MKLRLSVWLTASLFFFNTVFIMIVFNLVYSNLEEALVNRSEDKLNAINALKKELLERHFLDKQQEVLHMLSYSTSSGAPADELTARLSTLTEIKKVEVTPVESDTSYFLAALRPDSALFEFNFITKRNRVNLVFGMTDIQDILLQRTGLGATGESYIVNHNKRMMSVSLFYPQQYPASIAANTEGVKRALDGQEGVALYTDYRNVQVMGCYRPVDFHGIHMALLTEYNLQELMRPIYSIRENLLWLLILLLIIALGASTMLAGIFSGPIVRLRQVADQLSLGALPATLPTTGPVLELAQITESMDKLIRSLRQIVSFAGAIGKGRMDASYEKLSEHDELGEAVLRMRDQLISLDKEKTSLEINSKRILIEAQEKDRERVSRELHDGMGALLTLLKLRMEKSGVLGAHADMKDLLERTIAETRTLARNLMPSVLVDFGLNEALSQLVADITASGAVKIYFFNELENSEVKLGKDQNLYIYRIVQEALSNAVKHSGCTEISLSITVFEDHLVLYIKDNGRGFNAEDRKGFAGLGLKNMEERTRLLQGKLWIESNAEGTEIEIDIPLI